MSNESVQEQGRFETVREKYGREISMFGGRSAVKIKEATDRVGNPTVVVELAHREDGGFNWKNKVVFMFTQSELFILYCVLTRKISKYSFSNHGNDVMRKTLNIEYQGENKNFFMNVTAKGKSPFAVPFHKAEACMFTALVADAIKRSNNLATIDEVEFLVKEVLMNP